MVKLLIVRLNRLEKLKRELEASYSRCDQLVGDIKRECQYIFQLEELFQSVKASNDDTLSACGEQLAKQVLDSYQDEKSVQKKNV